MAVLENGRRGRAVWHPRTGAIVYIRSDQGGPAVTGFPPEKHDAAPTQKGEAAGTADSEFAVAMLRIGAREFNGNYFKVYNDPVTWHAAAHQMRKSWADIWQSFELRKTTSS